MTVLVLNLNVSNTYILRLSLTEFIIYLTVRVLIFKKNARFKTWRIVQCITCPRSFDNRILEQIDEDSFEIGYL